MTRIIVCGSHQVWFGLIKCGFVSFWVSDIGLVGLVWFGVVWCGVVWCGVVLYGILWSERSDRQTNAKTALLQFVLFVFCHLCHCLSIMTRSRALAEKSASGAC